MQDIVFMLLTDASIQEGMISFCEKIGQVN